MKFDILHKDRKSGKYLTTLAADLACMNQLVRLRHKNNQNQKLLKTIMKEIVTIQQFLFQSYDILEKKTGEIN